MQEQFYPACSQQAVINDIYYQASMLPAIPKGEIVALKYYAQSRTAASRYAMLAQQRKYARILLKPITASQDKVHPYGGMYIAGLCYDNAGYMVYNLDIDLLAGALTPLQVRWCTLDAYFDGVRVKMHTQTCASRRELLDFVRQQKDGACVNAPIYDRHDRVVGRVVISKYRHYLETPARIPACYQMRAAVPLNDWVVFRTGIALD